MSSLSDIRTNIRITYLKIDPNAKVWDDNVVDYYANRGYTKVQQDFKFEIPDCQTSYSLSTITWTQEYTKPSDLVSITGFFYNSQPLYRTTKQHTLLNQWTSAIPNQYYTYGSNIWLYPIPDSSYSLDIMYNKKLPKLTSVVDSVMSEDMEELIVLWSCYLMFLSVEKVNKAQSCIQQYNIAKDSMFGEIMYDDDSIRFCTNRWWNNVRDNIL